MFDIGFAELLIIGVVALMVIGPERLPEAVRTASAWINRLRRSFNEIKQEVKQELHNDEVLRDLRQSGETLRRESESLRRELSAPVTQVPADSVGTTAEQDVAAADTSAASVAVDGDTTDASKPGD